MGRHARSIRVKRMDCSVLGTLVINHEPIELVDVRSKNEFDAMRIPGAESLPFGELAAPGIFRRLRPTRERVCVIAADGHARASLATGKLRSAGCVNAVPVDGGMKDWVARGFPVRQKRIAANVRAYRSRVALSVMAAAAAAALHDLKLAALFLAIAGVLLLKVKFSQRRGVRQSAGLGPKQVMKDFGRPNTPASQKETPRDDQNARTTWRRVAVLVRDDERLDLAWRPASALRGCSPSCRLAGEEDSLGPER